MSNQTTSTPLACFRGYVTHIEPTSFEARIWEELEGVAQEEQEATIPRDLVAALDEELLVPGAFFSLQVVAAHDPAAPAKCRLRFAREPCYTAEDLRTARRRAEELLRDLQVE